MKASIAFSVLLVLLSGFASATTTYYPGNTDGVTAVQLEKEPPVYYPPQQPNPLINPKNTRHTKPKINPQVPQSTPPASTGKNN